MKNKTNFIFILFVILKIFLPNFAYSYTKVNKIFNLNEIHLKINSINLEPLDITLNKNENIKEAEIYKLHINLNKKISNKTYLLKLTKQRFDLLGNLIFEKTYNYYLVPFTCSYINTISIKNNNQITLPLFINPFLKPTSLKIQVNLYELDENKLISSFSKTYDKIEHQFFDSIKTKNFKIINFFNTQSSSNDIIDIYLDVPYFYTLKIKKSGANPKIVKNLMPNLDGANIRDYGLVSNLNAQNKSYKNIVLSPIKHSISSKEFKLSSIKYTKYGSFFSLTSSFINKNTQNYPINEYFGNLKIVLMQDETIIGYTENKKVKIHLSIPQTEKNEKLIKPVYEPYNNQFIKNLKYEIKGQKIYIKMFVNVYNFYNHPIGLNKINAQNLGYYTVLSIKNLKTLETIYTNSKALVELIVPTTTKKQEYTTIQLPDIFIDKNLVNKQNFNDLLFTIVFYHNDTPISEEINFKLTTNLF